MASCPNKEKNLADCNCTYHRSAGQIPACFFSEEAEATYNRSVAPLCRDCGVC